MPRCRYAARAMPGHTLLMPVILMSYVDAEMLMPCCHSALSPLLLCLIIAIFQQLLAALQSPYRSDAYAAMMLIAIVCLPIFYVARCFGGALPI